MSCPILPPSLPGKCCTKQLYPINSLSVIIHAVLEEKRAERRNVELLISAKTAKEIFSPK